MDRQHRREHRLRGSSRLPVGSTPWGGTWFVGAAAIEPVRDGRGEEFGVFVHERVTGVVDDCECGVWVPVKQLHGVGISGDGVDTALRDAALLTRQLALAADGELR